MQKYSPISDDEPNMREDSERGTYYWCEDVDARIAELEREIEKQKIREMRAKCLHCGHTLFVTEPNTTL